MKEGLATSPHLPLQCPCEAGGQVGELGQREGELKLGARCPVTAAADLSATLGFVLGCGSLSVCHEDPHLQGA